MLQIFPCYGPCEIKTNFADIVSIAVKFDSASEISSKSFELWVLYVKKDLLEKPELFARKTQT